MDADKENPNVDVKPGECPVPVADVEIIVHNTKKNEVLCTVGQPEVVKIPAYRAVYDKLLFKNSPIIMESNRWRGMLNVCFNFTGAEAIVFSSIYIGDGLKT